MRILRKKSSSCSGNTVFVSLGICLVVGLVLMSYLKLMETRAKIRAHSMAWNSAIPVLEAGIEEAFTHLHDDTNVLTANGWASVTNGGNIKYQKTRTNSDGSYYFVIVSNVSIGSVTAPVIYSQGFVPAPLGNGYISRLVQLWSTNVATFTKAIAAKGTISLGGSAIVDGYDSSNTNYSTGGQYDPTKRLAVGAVVTGSKSKGAVSVGTGHIYGTVDTAPGGTVTVGGSGSVGALGWTSGIEAGYTNSDFNFSYPDQIAPSGYLSWLAPAQGTYSVGGTNYDYLLGNGGYYQSSAFSMSSAQKMIVTGNATFYVAANISLANSAMIYIAPGASLKLYGGGKTTSIAGGGVVNGTSYASNFSYYGLPNNTSVTYGGSAAFIGTINAPDAAVSMGGGAGFYGGMIVNSFSDGGGSSIHYDEALGGNSVSALAITYSYREPYPQ